MSYEEVGNYYDKDAVDFEQRYWKVCASAHSSSFREKSEFPFEEPWRSVLAQAST